MTFELARPTCRYILAGPLNDAARWTSEKNLRLSKWAHHSLSRSRPDQPALRVYVLVEDGAVLESAVGESAADDGED